MNTILGYIEDGKSSDELFMFDATSRPLASAVRLLPAGWWDQNAAKGADLIYHCAVLPFKNREFGGAGQEIWGGQLQKTTPYNLLARAGLYVWTNVDRDILMAQADVDGLRVACALERFRLTTGGYPDSLDQLTPAYLQTIPKDPYHGETLSMEATKSGYRLSSSWQDKGPDDDWSFELERGEQHKNAE